MEISDTYLKILLDLHFSRFDKERGTFLYIAQCLGKPHTHVRAFLRKLLDEGVLYANGSDEIAGKNWDVYCVDKKRLLQILRNNETFKKIYILLFELYDDDVFGNFPDIFTKKERKEMIAEMRKGY